MGFTTRLIPAALLAGLGLAVMLPSAQARQDADPDTKCSNNLKYVALAFHMYVADYDGIMPPMKDLPHLQKIVSPYLKDVEGFKCPVSGVDYACNPYLGQLPLASIPSPASVPLFFDAKPHAGGFYRVAYLDGSVRRVDQAPVVKPIAIKKPRTVRHHAAKP